MQQKYLFVFIAFLLAIGVLYYLNQRGTLPPEDTAVVQSHRSYKAVVSETGDVTQNQPTRIVYRIENERGETLKDFAVAHEKLMHLIVVRQDLQHFQHLHPEFNQEIGEFTIDVTFPTAGPYRLFPDFTPAKEVNPQLLPITVFSDLEVGNARSYTSQPVTPDTQDQKMSEGYTITFLFPQPEALTAQNEVTYSLLIEKGGQPVTDLENYLGAKGHSVIIKEGTLDYIHTHALTEGNELEETVHGGEHMAKRRESAKKGNQIDFATTFPEPGVYKIFTQFQHQGKVITTDYVIRII